MPALNEEDRRNKDIYEFIMQRLNQKVGAVQKFRWPAILEMARERFYLSPDHIARIFNQYEPDPAQLNMFDMSDPTKDK